MSKQLEASIVRICSEDGQVVSGAGFLVSENHIITCAHVISNLLNLPDYGAVVPTEAVFLDFPMLAPGRIIRAHVSQWIPPSDDGGGDIATLELEGPTPRDAVAVRFAKADDDLWEHSFRAFGFPVGQMNGTWATGRLLGRQATRWVQIEDVKQTGRRIEPGFSGTPVWDEQLGGVVGMVVAADRQSDTKTAYMIPIDVLVDAWPVLKDLTLKFTFVSYSRQDEAFVAQLREDLQQRGIDIWIDREGLKPGTSDWEDTLRKAIRSASAILLVASPNSLQSTYVRAELGIAEMYKRPIYPVWAAGDNWAAVAPMQLFTVQAVDARGSRYETALNEIVRVLGGDVPRETDVSTIKIPVEEIRRRQQKLQQAAPEPAFEPRNPFKGLRAFTDEDVADFFGRERLAEELLARLQAELEKEKADTPAVRLLPIVGPSGSGKSSVVMAGLLPRLQDGALPGSKNWIYLKPIVPGKRPLENLAITLGARFQNWTFESIMRNLEEPRGLHQLASVLVKNPDQRVVLFIDQFEELFTQTSDETIRRQFIELLVTAVREPNGPVIVLLTLRADFYDRPIEYPEFGPLVKEQHEIVYPMSLDDLRAVIEKPAALNDVQLTFEGNLVGDLLFEVRGEAGALPLLQFTLDQLFQKRQGHALTLEAYREMGGVRGALARHAEDTFTRLPNDDYRRLARALFLRLIEPGTSEQDTTRRRAALTELVLPSPSETQMMQQVANRFIEARLLTTSIVGDVRTVEVSHEALIREWERLSGWLHEAREDIRFQAAISSDAAEWMQRGCKPDDDALYRGTILLNARQWAEQNIASAEEMAFIDAAVAWEQELLAREEQRKQELIAAAERAEQAQQSAQAAENRALRARRVATLVAAGLVLIAVAAAVITIIAGNRVTDANSFVETAQLQVTVVGSTLTPVGATLAAANQLVSDAQEQVLHSGETLTPIPQTLTLVGSTLVAGNAALADAQRQISLANAAADNASTQVAYANATLTPVGATLTPVGATLAAANALVSGAQAEVAQAQTQAALSGLTLTPVPQTLTPVALTLAAGNQQLQEAQSQIVQANAAADRASTQVAYANAVLTPVPQTLTPVGATLAAADALVKGAQAEVAQAQTQAAVSGQTLTPIPYTLTPVALTLAAGNQQLQEAQSQINRANEAADNASTQVAYVNATLTPVGATLTPVGATLAAADALVKGAQAEVAQAQTQAAVSGLTLTPIPQTLTPVGATLAAANAQVSNAQIAVAQAQTQAAVSGLTLTPVPQTLTPVGATLAAANAQVAGAQTQVAGVQPTLDSAQTQIAGVQPTLDGAKTQVAGVQPTLDSAETQVAGVQPTVAGAQTQVAAVLPTLTAVVGEVQARSDIADSLRLAGAGQQLLQVGNPDLAIALMLEAYRLNPAIVETQRVLNSAIPLTVRLDLPSRSARISLFSPDGKYFISAGPDGLEAWDIANRREVQKYPGGGSITVAAFSPDGHFLATGDTRGQVTLWDFEAGTKRFDFSPRQNGRINSLAFSPNRHLLISGSNDNTAAIWDYDSGSQLARLDRHEGPVVQVAFDAAHAFSYDAAKLTRRVVNYDLSTNTNSAPLMPTKYRGFSPDGQFAYTGGDGTDFLTLWNPSQGVKLRFFKLINANEDYVNQIAFSDDRRRVLVHVETRGYRTQNAYVVKNRYIALWDINTGAEIRRFQAREASATNWDVYSLTFSKDGRYALSGTRYGAVYGVTLWDTETGEELRRFTGHAGPVELVGFNADEHYAFSYSKGDARVWDIDTDVNRPVKVDFREGPIVAYRVSSDEKQIYLAYKNQSIAVWDIAKNVEAAGTRFYTGNQTAVAFSPTQPYALVSGAEGTVLWNIEKRSQIYRLEQIGPSVQTAMFSHDGRYLILVVNRHVVMWDVENKAVSADWSYSNTRHVEVSYNNEFLFAAAKDSIEMYDVINRQKTRTFTGFTGAVNQIIVSPSGDQLIAAVGEPDNAVLLWDVKSGNLIYTMVGHGASVNAVVISPDGKTVLSGSDDGTLILWDAQTGQSVSRYRGHSGPVQQVVFSPDGQLALSASDKNEDGILAWRVQSVQQTVDWVYANRYVLSLTCSQREQYNVRPKCVEGVAPTLTPTFTPQATFTPTATSTLRPTFTPTPTATPYGRIIAKAKVNVRSGPGPGFKVVGQIEPGARVAILEVRQETGWIRILMPNGRDGWVNLNVVDR
jgi:WD40 repeat protein